MLRIALALWLMLAPVSSYAGAGEPLLVRTASGDATFSVELANTPQRRTTGLMHRRQLDAGAGMLFDFMKPAPVSMWMKDTLIPLDMVFIRSDGIISSIAERTVPGSLTPIDSTGPVRAVLELNGGTCARLGIRSGGQIIHPLFKAAQ